MVDAAVARLDEVCSHVERPEHFTNHLHCDECGSADALFQEHTAVSLASLNVFSETLPISFLSDHGFRYMLPALVRILARDCRASDLLTQFENRLDGLSDAEAGALRDVLYALYEEKTREFESGFFAYETLWRVLDRLDLRLRSNSS